jgi:hypothetical protein
MPVIRRLSEEQKYVLEEFAFLTQNGVSREQAADQLGYDLTTIERYGYFQAAAAKEHAA